MAQFKAFAPGVEVNGETVLSVVAGLGAFQSMALKILEDNGIADPQPGQWYPQQAWLNAFEVIAQKLGANTLFNIGKQIPENAQFPPELKGIENALGALDMAYHMNHRGGEIGHYRFRSTGPRSGEMLCENPYPCDFDRGIIEAMARRFQPADSSGVRVRLDPSRPTRKAGADSCTYLVDW